MSGKALPQGSPLNPVQAWDALHATPEGAALIDAYLTLRRELVSLISDAQQAEIGKGLSVQALRERAESLTPLLEEPYGFHWTVAFWQARSAVGQALAPLEKYLDDRQRGYRHDFLIEGVVAKLLQADARISPEPDEAPQPFALEIGEAVALPAGRLRYVSAGDGVGAFEFTPGGTP